MRFEVPQFIEIEDKIFGPFTWKQGIYLGGGVGTAVVLFLIAPFWVTFVVGIPVAVLAAALAFYPVNSRPFSVLLEAMWGYYKNTRVYYWRRQRDVVYKSRQSGTVYDNMPLGGDNAHGVSDHKLELNVLGDSSSNGDER